MLRDKGSGAVSFLGNPILLSEVLGRRSEDRKAELALLSENSTFTAGEMVFRRGDPCDSIHILRSGAASIVIDAGFGRSLERRVLPDEVFGLPEALCPGSYETSLRAVSECEFHTIGSREFQRFLSRYPGACFRLVRLLGNNLHKGHELLTSLPV